MKKQLPLSGIFAFASALLFYACSSSTSYDEAMEINRRNIDDHLRIEDAVFLVDSYSLEMFQAELLRISGTAGYSSDVVTLGNENAGPFKTMQEELIDLAKREKIRLPNELKPEHEQQLQALKSSARTDFDHKVIDLLKETNLEEVRNYTLKATEAHDPDVRAFAARKLGQLRAHSAAIQKVEDRLLTTVKEEQE
jgi:putative membrane protein